MLAFAVVGVAVLLFAKAATPIRPAPTPAAGAASLSISPDATSVTTGKTFTVGIYENSGSTQIQGTNLGITYDPNLIQISDTATPLNSFNTSGAGITLIRKSVSVSGGNLSFAAYADPNTTVGYVTQNQLVTTITFVAKAVGTAQLSFQNSGAFSAITPFGQTSNIWDHNISTVSVAVVAATTTGGGGTPTGGGNTNTGTATPPTPAKTSTNSGTATPPTPAKTSTNTGTSVATTTPPLTSNSTQVTSGGFYVAVVVTDDQAQAVQGAEVTIDGVKATTDAAGVASFMNISSGSHKVHVSSTKGSFDNDINVLGTATVGSVQQFPVKLKKSSPIIIYIAAGSGVLVAGLAIMAVLRQRALKRMYGSYNSSYAPAESAVVSSSHDSSIAATPALVKPSETDAQVVKPTDPTV